MSSSKGIIGGLILIFIGIILIFAGSYILETIPESDESERSIEDLPREIGWAFIVTGIISIIIGLLVMIGVR